MTDAALSIRAALRRLDGDAFAAFVADLWRERGWRAERQGNTIRVERDGERRTLFTVPATRRSRWFGSIPEDADTVVSAAADESADVDASELVSMLRYAIPPEAADRLCERHLGAPPSELTLPMDVRARRAAGTLPLRKASAAVVLLIAVTALAAAGTPGGLFALGSDGSGGGDPATGGTGLEPLPANDTLNLSVLEERPVNTSELVAAHQEALADRDYLLRITRIRDTDLNERPLIVRETVKQVGDEYVYQLRPENDAGTISAEDIYSDGSAAYIAEYRSASSPYRYVRFETMPPTPREWTVGRLDMYLNTTAVTVERVTANDLRREYEIRGSGIPPNMMVRGYEFSATVTDEGFIKHLYIEYERIGGQRGTVEWRYSPVENAWVEPPAWYERKFGGENATPTATVSA